MVSRRDTGRAGHASDAYSLIRLRQHRGIGSANVKRALLGTKVHCTMRSHHVPLSLILIPWISEYTTVIQMCVRLREGIDCVFVSSAYVFFRCPLVVDIDTASLTNNLLRLELPAHALCCALVGCGHTSVAVEVRPVLGD